MQKQFIEEMIDYMPSVRRCKQSLDGLDLIWSVISANAEMNCPHEAVTILSTMQKTQEGFGVLEEKLIENLVAENIKKVVLDITSKAQVVVDIIIRNLYERTADVGFLATDNDIRQFILGKVPKEAIVQRLKEYRDKYTVYDEIIILDTYKRVLANLDETSGIISSKDPLVMDTIQQDGYLESFKKSDLRPMNDRSLIYSQKIEDPESGNVIGVLCLCFRFENEMEGIFASLKNKGDKSIMCLLDDNGLVIASSDESSVSLGKAFSIQEDSAYSVIEHNGRDYLAKTCKTRGYQGFFGLGWQGHVMVPADAFKAATGLLGEIDADTLDNIMQYADSFCPDLSAIVSGADDINLALRRVVWNGQVMAAGGKGDLVRLKAILRQISKNGQKTREVFESSISNLYQTVISSSLSDVKFIARLMIDIMDRNLYERANDCRWWALTNDIRRVLSLSERSEDDLQTITDILIYINSLYTVYTRIFVYDTDGTIVAASNLHGDNINLVGKKYDQAQLHKVMGLDNSQKYSVSAFQKTWLYGECETYVYNAAIRSLDDTATVVGGIGIVFDAATEFMAMLNDNLPQKDGAFAVFTDRSGVVISTTCDDYRIGSRLTLDHDFFALPNGEGISRIIVHHQKYFIVGCMTSCGYREYKNSGDYKNDLIAFVFVPIGDVRDRPASQTNATYNTGTIKSAETVELATFIVSDKIYSLPAASVVEAVEADKLVPLPGSKPYLVGTTPFVTAEFGGTPQVVPVINPKLLFNQKKGIIPHQGLQTTAPELSYKDHIVIIRTAKGLVGLLVQDLDAVPEFDASRLERVPPIIGADSGYVKSIIKPEMCGKIDDMLVVLDPDLLVEEIQRVNVGHA